MRPIKVDNDLMSFAENFAKNLFSGRRSDFISPETKLNDLLIAYSKTGSKLQIRILNLIISTYKKSLLCCSPEIQQKLVKYTDSKLGTIFFKGKATTQFSKEIVEALRYDSLQEHYAYQIADKLDLKTCPYCNAMLAITIQKGKKKKARYQLDHFFPKSKYPFLSTSFFNLIPSCGNCNQGKSNKPVELGKDFHLYSDKTPENAFKFELVDADVVRKIIGIRKDKIKIKITYENKIDDEFVKKHDKDYAIQSIYDTQKDIVEELVWKKQAYNFQKIEELEKILEISSSEIKRMILGSYVDFEDIHKRPLSKFIQDIGKDLGMIQKSKQ